ncbi:MAG: hypothetical protein GX442_23595 [Candidatus Riflebacteria bacterium]|nr:hypothetical protein [Candidatus Riflebacteria bacterium]
MDLEDATRNNEDVTDRVRKYLEGQAAWDLDIERDLRQAGIDPAEITVRGVGFNADILKDLKRYEEDLARDWKWFQEDERQGLDYKQEDTLRDREFLWKVEAEQRNQQIRTTIDLITSMKEFKGQIDHRIKILDQEAFIRGFMADVMKRAGVLAKMEGITVAGV